MHDLGMNKITFHGTRMTIFRLFRVENPRRLRKENATYTVVPASAVDFFILSDALHGSVCIR